MRPGRGLRVILYAENGMTTVPEAFERFVIQIHMGDFELVEIQRIRVDGESMIVRSNFHFVR